MFNMNLYFCFILNFGSKEIFPSTALPSFFQDRQVHIDASRVLFRLLLCMIESLICVSACGPQLSQTAVAVHTV